MCLYFVDLLSGWDIKVVEWLEGIGGVGYGGVILFEFLVFGVLLWFVNVGVGGSVFLVKNGLVVFFLVVFFGLCVGCNMVGDMRGCFC